MKRNKNKAAEGPSANNWMTTFSDLVTLLLTFFVLLFSMSSMDDQKLKIAFQNFGGNSGLLSFREYREISRPLEVLIEGLHKTLDVKVVTSSETNDEPADEHIRDLENSGNLLIIYPLSDGIKMSFGSNLLFTPGGVDIRENLSPVLDKIARFIYMAGYQVYIDGHTDSTPVGQGEFSSNEDLSIARAFSVRNHLMTLENIPPYLISITGYGDKKPVASNDLPEGREKNRRVEIIMKNQKYF